MTLAPSRPSNLDSRSFRSFGRCTQPVRLIGENWVGAANACPPSSCRSKHFQFRAPLFPSVFLYSLSLFIVLSLQLSQHSFPVGFLCRFCMHIFTLLLRHTSLAPRFSVAFPNVLLVHGKLVSCSCILPSDNTLHRHSLFWFTLTTHKTDFFNQDPSMYTSTLTPFDSK